MTIANRIFDDAQRDLLQATLNRIVPADGAMPAAGDLGIAQFIEGVAAERSTARRLFLDGLVQIRLAAAERGGAFSALPAAAQTETLEAVAAAAPEFFQQLVTQTYRGYYTNQTVFDLLQYRAPNRADYAPLPFDESLLEPVRQRGPIWVRTSG